MKITKDFMNLATEIDKKYYPEVGYYQDNKYTQRIHYSCELFNNGCLTYPRLIQRLCAATKDTKQNIHKIVSKYILDFEGFEYKH